jgi:hypothetical protein
MENQKTMCERCGHRGEIVYVHGHGQCPVCKNNCEPCCEGLQNNPCKENKNEEE